MKDQLFRIYQGLSLTQLTCIAVLLCVPAFIINLGQVGFIGDEAIRTLVAFEMEQRGNFIVPTLNGELYFNKPPLYNWIIYLVSQAFGYFGEWPTRMTTLLCLAVFAYWIYQHVRRHMDQLAALSVMLMTLTCGRILFWDSMLGLIDIGFSAVVFLNFMVLYQLGKQGRWRQLFIFSYLLFSLAFLLKGLPAVVFQGLSIAATLWFYKSFKQKIFSLQHVSGALIGILPVLLYYMVYARYVSLADVFTILSDQSLQRTATHHGIWKTVLHVFSFPFEQLYHFLPWSVIILMVLHPRSRSWIKENEFIRFNVLMIAVNLPVYWLSVQVYPRYLLMFVPLFFTVGYYLLDRSRAERPLWWRMAHILFISLASISLAVMLILPFIPRLQELNGLYWTWIACGLLMTMCVLGLFADQARMFVWMGLILLVVRICFNLVVLPIRADEAQENVTRADARRLAAHYSQQDWHIYGKTQLHEVARCYTALYKNEIIHKTDVLHSDSEALYLVDTALYPTFDGMIIDSLILERGERLALMRPRTIE